MNFTNEELKTIYVLVGQALQKKTGLMAQLPVEEMIDFNPIHHLIDIAVKCHKEIGETQTIQVENMEEFLDTQLIQFDKELSPAYHALRARGLNTVRDLINHSLHDYQKMNDIGPVKIKAIQRFLNRRGLGMKENE